MSKLKPFKILYAEDDEIIRDGYVKYLQSVFEYVYIARDGQEAHKLYIEKLPDILLFDINMPYIDGLKLIQKIRQKDTEVKIIILSAYLDQEKLLQAIPLGLISYLCKPVKKRELEEILFKTVHSLESENKKNDIIKLSCTSNFDRKNGILSDGVESIRLTKNEVILLTILSSKVKLHYSIDEILDEFLQYEGQKEMTYNSIRNIIKRLKPKLPPESLENYYGVGYKLCIV